MCHELRRKIREIFIIYEEFLLDDDDSRNRLTNFDELLPHWRLQVHDKHKQTKPDADSPLEVAFDSGLRAMRIWFDISSHILQKLANALDGLKNETLDP